MIGMTCPPKIQSKKFKRNLKSLSKVVDCAYEQIKLYLNSPTSVSTCDSPFLGRSASISPSNMMKLNLMKPEPGSAKKKPLFEVDDLVVNDKDS